MKNNPKSITILFISLSLIVFSFQSALSKTSSNESLLRASSNFMKGNESYEKNDYAAAADAYRLAIEEGIADSKLFYNYANTLFRLNQLGPSILFYEKARKLNPDDEDITFNLRFVNSQIVDKNPLPETNFLTKILWYLHSGYSINGGLWIFLGLFSSIFLFGIGALFTKAGFRMIFFIGITLCILGLMPLAPSLFYKINQQESQQFGIVLKPAIEMFSGPGESFQVLTKVHEGTKFEIIETRGEWVSVKLSNGKGGLVH